MLVSKQQTRERNYISNYSVALEYIITFINVHQQHSLLSLMHMSVGKIDFYLFARGSHQTFVA